MNKRTYQAAALASAVSVVLGGCTVGPDYKRPDFDLPQAWSAAPAGATAAAATARWWSVYSDPELDKLVDEALGHSLDLSLAAAHVNEAHALLGVARSDQFPTVYADGNRTRTRSSANSAIPLPPGTPLETTDTRAALNVSFELDFWGKYRRATEAARADLLASEAARDTVLISLETQVVQSYYALIALDARHAATLRALDRARESLELQRKRNQAGVISDFEFEQRNAEYEANLAQLPPLERDRSIQERALSVLLGRSPRAIVDAQIPRASRDAQGARTVEAAAAQPPLAVPAGLPSDLLLHRPDLREAEQRLAAANARIGVARAAYFPSISLTGAFGVESASLGSLFSGPSRIWNYGAQVTQPIFGGGRVGMQVDAAGAREQAALAQYRQAVSNAFREVQDAIVAQTKARESFDAERRRVAALSRSYELAKLRFQNGIASQLDVIDAERNLLLAELNRIEAERAMRAAVADLYRSLGSGAEATAKS